MRGHLNTDVRARGSNSQPLDPEFDTLDRSATDPAPKFNIPKHVISDMIDEDFTIKEIANILVVSERTIYHRMDAYGLSKLQFTDISDPELDEHVEYLSSQFPNCGERMLNKMFKDQGLFIQRARLRESLHRVDSEGVKSRKRNRLHRRVYNVQGANHLWHIDTNHKLVR